MSKHDAVYRDLRKKILDGTYASRSALESEEVLCKRYEVSRPTLRKALDALKQDGLIHSRQGSGFFVNPPEFFIENNLTTLSERYAGQHVSIESRVLELENVPAGEMAEQFQVSETDSLIHYRRLRIVGGKPHALENTYMPLYLFPGFSEKALYGSMIHYIEDECGYSISHVNKRISAISARGDVAELLNVKAGTPLLQVNHMVYLLRSVLVQSTEEITLDSGITITSVR
ncbi:GntR family transcriptional regulator [Olsenella sp. AF16-14LB]|jgi:DNA-binding GntR family transcriptional regulator|uniref:GntR family transcriptional regulator n=1 Tax=Atopobiaceae TaxID=1643824 RepID=UPI000E4412E3|nr:MULTISPECIES: GntR family transcriptional regulator [unclassified Olsenella]RGJ45620.1 GntR family transcriptional regulator [Olsenella sp. TM06-36]RGS51379.1 GntR family transcriptional regulator [Olsenella sp. AF21-51]RGU49640.1 GntR family transcriptional regulator [Olsenella sp. AF16-14LB]RGU81462.1 GntR family transcriptional regulator [Olsenella sp. AF15-43LB]RHB55515.1 GntR family transcriptional regulator [Olsenella sp. AM39-30AC]